MRNIENALAILLLYSRQIVKHLAVLLLEIRNFSTKFSIRLNYFDACYTANIIWLNYLTFKFTIPLRLGH